MWWCDGMVATWRQRGGNVACFYNKATGIFYNEAQVAKKLQATLINLTKVGLRFLFLGRSRLFLRDEAFVQRICDVLQATHHTRAKQC